MLIESRETAPVAASMAEAESTLAEPKAASIAGPSATTNVLASDSRGQMVSSASPVAVRRSRAAPSASAATRVGPVVPAGA